MVALNVKIKKYFDKEENELVLEVSGSSELIELLKECKSNSGSTRISSSYPKMIVGFDDEERQPEITYHDRYLVKTLVMNSINDYRGWSSIHEIFFLKDFLDTGTVKIIMRTTTLFNNFDRNVRTNLKELLEVVYSLRSKDSRTYNIHIDDGKEVKNDN